MTSSLLSDDGKRYLWPPKTIKELDVEQQEFERVTHVLSDGEPKHWMKPWVSKIIAEYVADNYDGLADYFRPRLSPFSPGDPSFDPSVLLAEFEGKVNEGIRHLKSLPDQLRDTAAVRGTDVHYYLEQISKRKKVVVPNHLLAHVDQGMEFLKLYKPRYLMTEQTVFSEEYGYAGSFDAIVEIPYSSASQWLFSVANAEREVYRGTPLRVLIDYKTADKGAKDSNALQLAMYRYADFIGHEDGSTEPVPSVDLCAVLSINADKFELVPMRTDQEIWEVCKSVIGVARWTRELSRTAMPSAKERKANKLAEAGLTPGEEAAAQSRQPSPAYAVGNVGATEALMISDIPTEGA